MKNLIMFACLVAPLNASPAQEELFHLGDIFDGNEYFYNDREELLVEFEGHLYWPMILEHHPDCGCQATK